MQAGLERGRPIRLEGNDWTHRIAPVAMSASVLVLSYQPRYPLKGVHAMSSIGASHDRRARAATGARRQARELKAARIVDLVPDGYEGYPVSGDSITAFMGIRQPVVAGSLWERVAS